MFKVAICEDNHIFLEYEKELVEKYISEVTNKYRCDAFRSGEELLSKGDNVGTYDFVILDCKMNALDGVATAEQIRSYNRNIKILFITEYYEYSYGACNVEAIGYILKNSPDFEYQLQKKICRVYEDTLSNREKYITDFSDGVYKVNIDDIIYINSDAHYLCFFIKPEEGEKQLIMHKKRAKIIDVIDMLDCSFVRVSSSFIVNLQYATAIVDSIIRIECGAFNADITIRRGDQAMVEERFNKYYGAIKW